MLARNSIWPDIYPENRLKVAEYGIIHLFGKQETILDLNGGTQIFTLSVKLNFYRIMLTLL